jgi:hypothetical protein
VLYFGHKKRHGGFYKAKQKPAGDKNVTARCEMLLRIRLC